MLVGWWVERQSMVVMGGVVARLTGKVGYRWWRVGLPSVLLHPVLRGLADYPASSSPPPIQRERIARGASDRRRRRGYGCAELIELGDAEGEGGW